MTPANIPIIYMLNIQIFSVEYFLKYHIANITIYSIAYEENQPSVDMSLPTTSIAGDTTNEPLKTSLGSKRVVTFSMPTNTTEASQNSLRSCHLTRLGIF